MTHFEIPKTIEDVTPELCRRIFTDICGGTVQKLLTCEREVWFLNNKMFENSWEHKFNPFLNIQDTKLCDPWLVENDFCLQVMLFRNQWRCKIDSQNFINVMASAQTEEMARMCAVLMAYNKLMGEG